MISLTAKCLEAILNERVDLSQIAFVPKVASRSNYSLKELTALWLPVISIGLSYTEASISVTRKDISKIIFEDNALENISQQVSTLIYANQATTPNLLLQTFKNYVSPTG